MGRPLGSRYELEESLGRGAMGEVFAAHDLDGRDLAVKVLHSDLARDQTIVARFVQERGILLAIESPHLVRVHDLVAEGETLAIVMDRVHGPDLKHYLDEHGTLPPSEVCRLGAGIASGLAAVHAAGAVHRDVKPENVLLDMSSGLPSPKVTDFGIAALADSERARSTMLVGTPEFIAPELADGSTPTPAADLYSLGILLYRLACGVTPFAGGSLIAVLKRASEHQPGRPAGIPDDLWDLITWLLAKDPAQRPDSAQRVAFQLQALAPSYDGVPAAPRLIAPPDAPTVGTGPLPTEAAAFMTRPLPTGAVPPPPDRAPETVTAAQAPAKKGKKGLIIGSTAAAVALLAAGGITAFTLLRPTSDSTGLPAGAVVTSAPPSPSATASPTASSASPTPSATPSATTAAPGTVPNLVGMLLPDAQKALGPTARIQVTDSFEPARPDGTVLTQQPAAGTPLSTMGTMKVTVARSAVSTYLTDLKPVGGSWDSQTVKAISGVTYPHAVSAGFYCWNSGGDAVEYNLSRNYQTFEATAGIADDSASSGGTALVEVFADGRKLYSQTVAYGQPFPISVDMTDVLRLKIQWQSLGCGADKNGHASVVLGDARVLGAPGKVPQPTPSW